MGAVLSRGSGAPGAPPARPSPALSKARGGKDAAALLGEVSLADDFNSYGSSYGAAMGYSHEFEMSSATGFQNTRWLRDYTGLAAVG